MVLSNKIRFWSKGEAVPTSVLTVQSLMSDYLCSLHYRRFMSQARWMWHCAQKECKAWDEGRRKIRRLLPVTVLALPTFTTWTLHSNWSLMMHCSGLFVWNKITVTHSCSFHDAVREAFLLFPNVPEIKEKKKKFLNLLLKRKDVLGLLSPPLVLRFALVSCFAQNATFTSLGS